LQFIFVESFLSAMDTDDHPSPKEVKLSRRVIVYWQLLNGAVAAIGLRRALTDANPNNPPILIAHPVSYRRDGDLELSPHEIAILEQIQQGDEVTLLDFIGSEKFVLALMEKTAKLSIYDWHIKDRDLAGKLYSIKRPDDYISFDTSMSTCLAVYKDYNQQLDDFQMAMLVDANSRNLESSGAMHKALAAALASLKLKYDVPSLDILEAIDVAKSIERGREILHQHTKEVIAAVDTWQPVYFMVGDNMIVCRAARVPNGRFELINDVGLELALGDPRYAYPIGVVYVDNMDPVTKDAFPIKLAFRSQGDVDTLELAKSCGGGGANHNASGASVVKLNFVTVNK
jgi:hypothetical protein